MVGTILAALFGASGALLGSGVANHPFLATSWTLLGALVGGLLGVGLTALLALGDTSPPVPAPRPAAEPRATPPPVGSGLPPLAEPPPASRDAFLERMSHELRTPLNAVLGYSEMLLEEVDDDALQGDVRRIRQAGRHLLGLVTSILDLTQLQSGRFRVVPEAVDLVGLVDEIVDGARPQAEANRNRMEVTVAVEGPVRLDPRLVRSILFNLVHNAAKYTHEGLVEVDVRTDDAGVRLYVADDGIGMTPRQLEEAFVPFEQGDTSRTRAYDGTGLGLAVCRGFTEAMGGTLTVDSALGEGARITVRLPREVLPSEEHTDTQSEERTMIMR